MSANGPSPEHPQRDDYAHLRGSLATNRRLVWVIGLSIALHVGAIGGLGWASTQDGKRLVVKEPPIVTRLVKLGQPKPEKNLPRIAAAPTMVEPQRKAKKPAAPEPPKPKVEKKKKKPEPPKPKAKKPEKKKPDTVKVAAARRSRMAEALARIRKQVPEHTDEDGSARSDSAAEGSRDGVKDGDVTDPNDARAGERYFTLLQRHIRRFYVLPSIISNRERMFLKAVLTIRIDADGRVISHEFSRTSGNSHFDSALEAAVKKASPVPKPPSSLRKTLRDSGVDLVFKP